MKSYLIKIQFIDLQTFFVSRSDKFAYFFLYQSVTEKE